MKETIGRRLNRLSDKCNEALIPHRGLLAPNTRIVLDHALGLLAQTMGKIDDANDHFGDAITFCRKAGYLPELAWTCYDYANCLTERHGVGDQDKAI